VTPVVTVKNLGVTSDRQFDKEGKRNFRENAKKRRTTTFLERERVGSFYKNKQNIFLEPKRVGSCYYKNKN